MDKSRFMDMTKEEKSKLTINDFMISERIEIINETVLSPENRKIAYLRFIKALTLEMISEKIGRDYKTVQRRVPVIQKYLNATIQKFI